MTSLSGQTINNLIDYQLIVSRQSLFNKMYVLSGDAKKVEVKRSTVLIDDMIQMYAESSGLEGQALLLKKYKSSITNYLEDISQFGESKSTFLFTDLERFPVQFSSFKNQLMFVQGGIYSDFAYNTIRSTTDGRSLKVTKDIALPSLYNLQPLLSLEEVKYFMIMVGYTATDFSSDSVADKDAELIALIVSKATLKRYLKSEISDEELLKLSILYNINKNTSNNLKKITT